MARRELSPACWAVVAAVQEIVPAALAETGLTKLAVGLSGGPDSLALAAAVAHVKSSPDSPLAQIEVTAHIVDHGLQPDSAAVATKAAAQAEALGLVARVSRVQVTPTPDGLEADARRARYGALLGDGCAPPARPRVAGSGGLPPLGRNDICLPRQTRRRAAGSDDVPPPPAAAMGPEAAELVVVGHTLDDQAETVLLGLARGSGLRSLAGMPVRSGRLVRPLLGVRRAQTLQACRDWGLTPWFDPMNADTRFGRTRVRTALATLEEALGPSLTEALARTAYLADRDATYLEAQAAAAWQGVAIGESLGAVRLAALPEALRGRVILLWLRHAGSHDVGAHHVTAVERLALDWHGQDGVDVPGGRVERRDGRLIFEPRRDVTV